MIKFISLMKKRNDLSLEAFLKYWHEQHGRFAYMVPNLKRYVQNHAVRLPGGGEPPVDGIGEYWFEDLSSWQKSSEFYFSEAGKVIREDEEKFTERNKLFGLVTEEKIIIP
jgi:uncharacterized protein (TIGR02118 family)